MKRTHLVLVVSIVLVSLAGAGVYMNGLSQSNGLPQSVRSQISGYTPYYPPQKSLPAGYYVDEQTFSTEQRVLNFTIKSADGTPLLVSQQQTPENFDFRFFEENLKNARNSQTSHGTIIVGEIESRHIASMRYGDTWIMISAPRTVSLSELEAIAQSFRQ